MDAVFGVNATLVSWVLAALAALLTLLAIMTALAAARQARAAAHDAERAAASLIQLHREAERLHAAWRADVAALARLREAPPPQHAPQPAPPPQQAHPPQYGRPVQPASPPQPLPSPPPPQHVPRSPLVATRTPEPPSDRTIAVPAWAPGRSVPTHPTDEAADADADELAGETTMMFGRVAAPAQPKDQFHGMPVLRVTLGADQGQEFKLPFQACTIGRAGTNRVVLAEDKASRVHAEVRFEQNRFFLKDAGSTNGTLRNGSPVIDDVLEFGDIIAIGKTELLFTCEGFDLKDSEPTRAIAAFERLLEREPDFVPGLQNLAFLLERDVARRRDAEGVWKRLKRLET
jgi:hypothetical protein